MSDDQKVEKAEFSDEMRESAQKCAELIKEHDFAVMGYGPSVVEVYAEAFERGRIGPGEDISKDRAAMLITGEFEALYGKSLEEARGEHKPGLDMSSVLSGKAWEWKSDLSRSVSHNRTASRDHGNDGHER